MARRRWILAIGVLALLGGCGRAQPVPVEFGDTFNEQQDLERQRRQAREALVRYDRAVEDAGGAPLFVPIGELTRQVGDWESSNEQNKSALGSGVITHATLPAAPRPRATVVWDDGARRTVPLVSAEQALDQLIKDGRASGACPECRPLEVTGARLTEGQLPTTRGPATVPVWEYTFEGTAVRATRVAVDATAIVTVIPPPWDAVNPPSGLGIDHATTAAGSPRLVVSFTGAPGTGDQACGADYTAEAVESKHAVVVIVIAHNSAPPLKPNEACNALGAPRTATVDLARPLGERAVLEVMQGLPVGVTTTR
jgi:hypothetical protein